MEQLIAFILENFIIILFLLAGLSGLFGGKKSEENQRQRPQRRTEPTQSQQPQTGPVHTRPNVERDRPVRRTREPKQREQKVRETSEIGINEGIQTEQLDNQLPTNRRRSPEFRGKYSLSMKKQLTSKRITESFIMKEVLGPPRAHQPYEFRNKLKK
ncbi:hypothetical protein [Salirhabdus salicampi]|uniref:hypothetical protein n=1 Tax=Salirhabdus salicampi TaxID=476102 RepID=UPI0020C3CC6B|nr:hypothetical protein [Salirhabdus salicampi]MCP8616903.1 hypothetical protein [Salirhabdus salicampi]